MADNRRSSTRHIVSLPCKVTIDGTPRDANMINLSLGGALVEAGEKFAMGTRAQIAFHIPRYESEIEVGATVRWSDVNAVGLQFDGLRARDVWALNEYFKLLSS